MKYILLISAGLLLSGCFQMSHGITCPELKRYTQEEQLLLAAELSQSDQEMTQKVIADYMKTRDAIRVCQSWQESYR